MAWTAEAVEQVICPEGLYLMKVADVGEPEESTGQFGTQVQVKVIFQIERVIDSNDDEAEEWVGKDIWGYANYAFTPNAKLRKWCEALLNRPIEDGEAISSNDIIGKRAKVTMGRSKTGGQKVTDLLPYVPKKKAPAKTAAPADDVEGFDDEEADEDELF